MRLNWSIFRFFAVLAAVSSLAACNSNPLIVEITDCPAVGFVRYANSLTAFAPGVTPIATQVSHRVTLSSLEVDCQDRGEGIRTIVDFTITAEGGPALQGTNINVPYFLVVAREGDDLQSKRIYSVDMALDGSNSRTRVRERVEFIIPTNRMADDYAYEVLIGFELSDAEARYNLES